MLHSLHLTSRSSNLVATSSALSHSRARLLASSFDHANLRFRGAASRGVSCAARFLECKEERQPQAQGFQLCAVFDIEGRPCRENLECRVVQGSPLRHATSPSFKTTDAFDAFRIWQGDRVCRRRGALCSLVQKFPLEVAARVLKLACGLSSAGAASYGLLPRPISRLYLRPWFLPHSFCGDRSIAHES